MNCRIYIANPPSPTVWGQTNWKNLCIYLNLVAVKYGSPVNILCSQNDWLFILPVFQEKQADVVYAKQVIHSFLVRNAKSIFVSYEIDFVLIVIMDCN